MDSIDRTAHIVPVACVPTGTTRHEQRPDLPFLLASVASALDPRCTLRYIVHSTQCLSLPAGAPQEGKYSASHQDTPSQLSSGSPSYHSPAEHCNRQSAHQGPGQTRDWLGRRPIPGRLPEGSWRFAHCSDSARFLLRVQADVAASWHHQSHAGTSCQTVVASKCCGNPGVLRGDTPAPASC